MIVKYVKSKPITKNGYDFIQIMATKDDGSAYTKDFFENNAEMTEKLDQFAPGEFLKLSYDTTKYKNLADIEAADGFEERQSKGSSGGGGKKNTSSHDSGNSRGEDTNRSAAIYLAKEVVFKCLPKSTDVGEVLSNLFAVADDIKKYIADGINPSIESGLEVPDIKED